MAAWDAVLPFCLIFRWMKCPAERCSSLRLEANMTVWRKGGRRNEHILVRYIAAFAFSV